MNKAIVITPTVLRATWLMREMYRNRTELLKVVSISERKIVTKDGSVFYFVGETEGIAKIRGFHGKVMQESEFLKKFDLKG